jgi:hypothetical protein
MANDVEDMLKQVLQAKGMGILASIKFVEELRAAKRFFIYLFIYFFLCGNFLVFLVFFGFFGFFLGGCKSVFFFFLNFLFIYFWCGLFMFLFHHSVIIFGKLISSQISNRRFRNHTPRRKKHQQRER